MKKVLNKNIILIIQVDKRKNHSKVEKSRYIKENKILILKHGENEV